ncbi:addiction module HigA family antidote [Anoxybacillus tepidamans]|uniref:Addiction module HigA family antidote n=1 Tax=Anoxybacteroides tepidamans TaxID=265948 RepID=A0A7W8IS11_9BACL|nr:HigA family addiction module antitoxin [Anoxybacillus tepidamans]MBB5324871.1 addiction module HigA family antidote [Anoxybacillus tepidamans]
MVNKFNPDYIIPPGETLAELLDYYGMTQAELANRIGKTTKTVNEIIKGKAPITPETALQLEKVFNVSAAFWNNLESNYRQLLAKKAENEHLQRQIDQLEKFPITFMTKNRWIEKHTDEIKQLEELFKFFGVASFEAFEKVCQIRLSNPDTAFRQTGAFEINRESVAVWLRRGEILAREIECEPYNEKKFKEALLEIRKFTSETPDIFVPKLVRLCSQCGVAVVFVPETPKSRVSGATKWLNPQKALIQLSFRYRRNDSLWFTFFHEAGHILLHSKKETFVDLEDNNEKGDLEEEANQFAANFLISPSKYKKFIEANDFSTQSICSFADELQIAPGIVVGRLQHDGIIPFRSILNKLKISYRWDNE